jgi:hypothetical protein
MNDEESKIPDPCKPQRDSNGLFLPGNTVAKEAWATLKGRARWERIVDYYRTHCTVDELREMATDTARLGKMPIEYAQVIVHLAGTIAGKDKRGEREALYDRLWGYPVQTTREKSKEDVDSAEELSDADLAAVVKKEAKSDDKQS